MYKLLIFLSAFCLLISCGEQPEYIYTYNKNPQYTHGSAVFYGAYYSNYDNPNHVISLSLLSDSLNIEDGNLIGIGQNMYIEDIFMPPSETDVLLHEGTYTATDSGEPFTFYGGEVLKIDNVDYTLGAYIYFIEKNSQMSQFQLIESGSFTVSNAGTGKSGPLQTITCDFILADGSKLAGTFSGELACYNQSTDTLSAKKTFRWLDFLD